MSGVEVPFVYFFLSVRFSTKHQKCLLLLCSILALVALFLDVQGTKMQNFMLDTHSAQV